jgi:hypothetical protein
MNESIQNPRDPSIRSIRHYFVDESGDGIIFDKKGKILLYKKETPKHFILGMADVLDPMGLNDDLESLRRALMADPYFKTVPSMQSENKKTALYFHAKDDVPEVRREVFKVLLLHEIRFFAVVKRMEAVLEYVLRRNRHQLDYRYRPNELYDHTVRRLFKQRLHKERPVSHPIRPERTFGPDTHVGGSLGIRSGSLLQGARDWDDFRNHRQVHERPRGRGPPGRGLFLVGIAAAVRATGRSFHPTTLVEGFPCPRCR